MKTFEDETGKQSSTRIVGSFAALAAIVGTFAGLKPEAVQPIFTFATILLGAGQAKSAFVQRDKNKQEKKKDDV